MPQNGSTYTPSVGDAQYPNFTGDAVQDPIIFTTYNPAIAYAGKVPYKIQNEVLKHQSLLVGQTNSITTLQNQVTALQNAAASIKGSFFDWQSFN